MILLDSHIVLAVLGFADITLTPAMRREITTRANIYVSVATIWELSIKHRLGKLGLSVPPERLADLLAKINAGVLPILAAHAVADVDPEPSTRDPFDRLLLGVCMVERLQLLTLDNKLADHPLAWREH